MKTRTHFMICNIGKVIYLPNNSPINNIETVTFKVKHCSTFIIFRKIVQQNNKTMR